MIEVFLSSVVLQAFNHSNKNILFSLLPTLLVVSIDRIEAQLKYSKS
jgi:hypothetical protein